MFISIFNFHKYKKQFSIINICAVLIVSVVIFAAITTSFFGSDRYVYAMQIENEKSLVIIDAGHGGEDPGAISASGIYEKDLNLEIAFELGEALEDAGFAVLYTRTVDKLLYKDNENVKGIRKISDLKNRCKIAAEYPNAIFISVHMNSYASPKYSGLHVYYSTKNEDSVILAQSIQSNVKELLQPDNNRTVKEGKDIYLLENVNSISVLIECGFITNENECKKLSEKEYQKQLSSAIVCGIIEYRTRMSAS